MVYLNYTIFCFSNYFSFTLFIYLFSNFIQHFYTLFLVIFNFSKFIEFLILFHLFISYLLVCSYILIVKFNLFICSFIYLAIFCFSCALNLNLLFMYHFFVHTTEIIYLGFNICLKGCTQITNRLFFLCLVFSCLHILFYLSFIFINS